jgi:hypothetical protein
MTRGLVWWSWTVVVVVLAACTSPSLGRFGRLLGATPPPWAHALGATGSDQLNAPAADVTGNIAAVGNVGSTCFVIDYSPAGVQRWTQTLGGTLGAACNAVAVDRTTGDVLVTGSFAGTFGILSANGSEDIFVTRLAAATGAVIWSVNFGGPSDDEGHAITVDPTGNILVTGYFRGVNVPFGATLLSGPNTTNGNLFVLSLTSTGTPIWAVMFQGATAENFGAAVAVDGAGNVAVGGFFMGRIIVNGVTYIASNGQYDGLLVEFTAAGVPLWSRRIGRSTPLDGDERVLGVATDSGGNVLATGWVQGSVDFGGGVVTSLGGFDAFVAKYTSTGAFVFASLLGGPGNDLGFGVRTDAADNVLLTGSFVGTATLGGVTLVAPSLGSAYVAEYGPTGLGLGAQKAGGSGGATGQGIVAVPGAVVIVGYFAGGGVFDGVALGSAGSNDGFIMSGPEPGGLVSSTSTSTSTTVLMTTSTSTASTTTTKPSTTTTKPPTTTVPPTTSTTTTTLPAGCIPIIHCPVCPATGMPAFPCVP